MPKPDRVDWKSHAKVLEERMSALDEHRGPELTRPIVKEAEELVAEVESLGQVATEIEEAFKEATGRSEVKGEKRWEPDVGPARGMVAEVRRHMSYIEMAATPKTLIRDAATARGLLSGEVATLEEYSDVLRSVLISPVQWESRLTGSGVATLLGRMGALKDLRDQVAGIRGELDGRQERGELPAALETWAARVRDWEERVATFEGRVRAWTGRVRDAIRLADLEVRRVAYESLTSLGEEEQLDVAAEMAWRERGLNDLLWAIPEERRRDFVRRLGSERDVLNHLLRHSRKGAPERGSGRWTWEHPMRFPFPLSPRTNTEVMGTVSILQSILQCDEEGVEWRARPEENAPAFSDGELAHLALERARKNPERGVELTVTLFEDPESRIETLRALDVPEGLLTSLDRITAPGRRRAQEAPPHDQGDTEQILKGPLPEATPDRVKGEEASRGHDREAGPSPTHEPEDPGREERSPESSALEAMREWLDLTSGEAPGEASREEVASKVRRELPGLIEQLAERRPERLAFVVGVLSEPPIEAIGKQALVEQSPGAPSVPGQSRRMAQWVVEQIPPQGLRTMFERLGKAVREERCEELDLDNMEWTGAFSGALAMVEEISDDTKEARVNQWERAAPGLTEAAANYLVIWMTSEVRRVVREERKAGTKPGRPLISEHLERSILLTLEGAMDTHPKMRFGEPEVRELLAIPDDKLRTFAFEKLAPRMARERSDGHQERRIDADERGAPGSGARPARR